MRESKSRALPLGDTPISLVQKIIKQGIGIISQSLVHLGWVMGFEPTTPGTTIRCSNQLSYTHHIYFRTDHIVFPKKGGTPEGTRTPDPLLRRQLLYPAELQAQAESVERVMGIEPT